MLALVRKEYEDAELVTDRLSLLRRLMEGAGVTLVTGPRMLPFWKAVSHEVKLRVEPDGYEVRGRTSGMQWALECQGLSGTAAARLVKQPPKAATHQHMPQYMAATALLATLGEAEGSIVKEEAPSHILKGDIAIELLEGLKDRAGVYDDEDPVALDWEYDSDTHILDGLNVTVPIRRGTEYREENWYIPLRAKDYTAPPSFARRLQETVASLHDAHVYTVYHNGKSDLSIATPEDRDPLDFYGSPIHDTIVMGYVLGYGELGLKELAESELGRRAMHYPGKLAELPVALAARYGAAGDTRNTLHLYRHFRRMLLERGQWGVYDKIERPIVPLVASMEVGGQPVDIVEMQRIRSELEYTMEGLRQHVWAKHRLDLSSDKDQLKYATKMLGYNPGTVSNEKLAPKSDGDWLDTLIGYRKLRHTKRAFLDKHIARWERSGRPADFRTYSHFNQAGSADERDERSFKRAARTGRFTSSGAKRNKELVGDNLQNQSGLIRSAFRAPEGCVFWSFDYSGLEIRIAAAMSGDPAMMAVLTETCPAVEDGAEECPHTPKHGDMHGQFKHTAFLITGVNVDRTIAKNWNFGSQYGAGPDTQVKTLAKARAFIDFETAKKLDKAHHETYAVYHEANTAWQEIAVERGYSETYFGRRRYDEDLRSSDWQTLGHAKRAAGNMPIQGTAADLLKIVMGEAVPILQKYGAHLSLQVHDEIAGWVPEAVAEEFCAEMKALMESKYIKGLQMAVEGGYGKNWSEVH